MTVRQLPSCALRNVRAPLSLLSAPDEFGGRRDGDCLVGDLAIVAGRVVGMTPAKTGGIARMVLPKLTECHVHLDKCHTVGRMDGIGGDLREAIAAQAADKANWTREDIHARAARGLDELITAGCGAVRSHVDWPGGDDLLTPPPAWEVLRDLADAKRDLTRLQLAPLIGAADFADEAKADALAALIAREGGVLGVFVLDHDHKRARIETAFRLADRYGLALDFHVDEGLDETLDGLEVIADVALSLGHQGPVLCGHACSLMNRQGDDLARLLDKLARSGVTVAALPSTNLYLQGRGRGTPDRRGLTRLSELAAAGAATAVGTDNVRDAFCPVGRHDPLRTLELAALSAHLDPPYGDHLPLITTNARRAMGLDAIFIDGADVADLQVFAAPTTTDLLSAAARPTPLVTALEEELA